VATPTVTLTLPDGRTLSTQSTKRWHVIVEQRSGRLVRSSSTDTRERAIAHWRRVDLVPCWVIDCRTGNVERTPESPRVA
jgi:hypothetical protein